jgi:hypothetical protein
MWNESQRIIIMGEVKGTMALDEKGKVVAGAAGAAGETEVGARYYKDFKNPTYRSRSGGHRLKVGRKLFLKGHVNRIGKVGGCEFHVKSENGNQLYHVNVRDWSCPCSDHLHRGFVCKHLYAAYFACTPDEEKICPPPSKALQGWPSGFFKEAFEHGNHFGRSEEEVTRRIKSLTDKDIIRICLSDAFQTYCKEMEQGEFFTKSDVVDVVVGDVVVKIDENTCWKSTCVELLLNLYEVDVISILDTFNEEEEYDPDDEDMNWIAKAIKKLGPIII